MSKIWHEQKREYYVLHNTPFYFVETVPTPLPPVLITKVVCSLYDLQKSAAHWDICDYGVTKSPDCST